MRRGDYEAVKALLLQHSNEPEETREPKQTEGSTSDIGTLLAIARNAFGRTALHVAVLRQQEEVAEALAIGWPDTLRIGDNVRYFIYNL